MTRAMIIAAALVSLTAAAAEASRPWRLLPERWHLPCQRRTSLRSPSFTSSRLRCQCQDRLGAEILVDGGVRGVARGVALRAAEGHLTHLALVPYEPCRRRNAFWRQHRARLADRRRDGDFCRRRRRFV